MAEQYIFTIERLSKAYAKREVLKNIWLAFYPGAKIGVIGSNGAGKSSLLRIMAGVDTDFLGSARLTPGFSVGFVPQEPRLDESTDARDDPEHQIDERAHRPSAPVVQSRSCRRAAAASSLRTASANAAVTRSSSSARRATVVAAGIARS